MSILLQISFCVLGAVSLSSQVLLLRALIVTFLGSELTIGVSLCFWMLFTALGAWVGHLTAAKKRLSFLVTLQLLTAFFIPLSLFAARSLRAVLGGFHPGETLGLMPMVLSTPVLLAPLCLLIGMQFPAMLALSKRVSGGKAYALEGAGAVFGGAVLTYILIPNFSPFNIAFSISLIQIACSILFMLSVSPNVRTMAWKYALILLSLMEGLFLWISSERLERLSLSFQWKGLIPVVEKESPYGNIVVVMEGKQFSLYENGLLSYSTQDYALREEAVHLPMLFRPTAEDILAFGQGAGALEEILKHRVASVDYVEIDPFALKTLRPHLPPSSQKSLSDPRISIHFMDPRRFIKAAAKHYDVILVDLPLPSTAMLNRCYTIEFFREAGGRLKRGGILSLGLPSSEAYLGREMRLLSASILRSLKIVFPYVRAIPGEKTYFISSYDLNLMKATPELLARMWREKRLHSRFITASYIYYRLSAHRVSSLMKALESSPLAPVNEDLKPVSYFYGILLFISQFSPLTLRALEALERTSPWLIAVPLLILPLLGLFLGINKRIALSMGIIGFTGMALEIVLLYVFQAFYGYVYNHMGILLALFMAGLSIGSAAGIRHQGVGMRTVIMLLSACSLCLAPLLLILRGRFSPLLVPVFSLLLALFGFLTGYAFPVADRSFRKARGTSIIYASDLIGGALGAIITGVILVPLMGILNVCMLLGGICASALIFGFLQRPGP